MIGSRDPIAFDVERVAEAAAARGVIMEINASPERLDLSDVHARLARERGCRFVIDTDAHAVGQLENIRYGVFQARRAGLTRDDVWNTLAYDRFQERLRERRGPATAARPARAKPAPEPSAPKPAPNARAAQTVAQKTAARPAAKPRPKARPARG
jgi:DNA polymerase (family 10)